jgi:hypothetical protein
MERVSLLSVLFDYPFLIFTHELVIVKNPSDFIGAVLGASEANTKAILANTVGKVLVIDEVSYSPIKICISSLNCQ